MSKTYFISDLHIRDVHEEKAQKLLRFLFFLQQQDQPIHLILGGDIFDLWLGGHKYFIQKFHPIIDSLKKLVNKKSTIDYFEGNHDFHLKAFWEKDMGVSVHTEADFFLFDKTIVRFEHGDEMDPEDLGYHFLRWVLRTSIVTFLIVHLPAGVVSKIGEWASHTSRKYTDRLRDEERIRKILHTYSEKIFDERHFDLFVHGHVHLQDEFVFERHDKTVTSINLGSWDNEQKVLVLENNKWSWLDVTSL